MPLTKFEIITALQCCANIDKQCSTCPAQEPRDEVPSRCMEKVMSAAAEFLQEGERRS